MKLIIGLGNVGDKYCFTRHNIGFMTVDKLALEKNVQFRENIKLKCFITKFKYASDDVMLIKPTTFMNLSGSSLKLVMDYYKIHSDDILVVYDDLSLDLGRIRFRPSGSDGGHNGIKSIIKSIGTQSFARLKIGIGPQPPIPSEHFVLQNFDKSQLDDLKHVLKKSIEGIEFYLDNDMQATQNRFN
ncbi:aminoacyl-tRNA hydrolase [bacterium]|nr:aminoacyl-tRNA hydrolase [bacterium]